MVKNRQAARGRAGAASGALGSATGSILAEVRLGVTAELGRRKILVRDLLGLSRGAVVDLDRAVGAPVDLLVNGTVIARGEVVVIDDEFGIQVTEVLSRPAA